jgi:hypothetical protein
LLFWARTWGKQKLTLTVDGSDLVDGLYALPLIELLAGMACGYSGGCELVWFGDLGYGLC